MKIPLFAPEALKDLNDFLLLHPNESDYGQLKLYLNTRGDNHLGKVLDNNLK
jgi:hypothetical protein